jgi:hypothetical protein
MDPENVQRFVQTWFLPGSPYYSPISSAYRDAIVNQLGAEVERQGRSYGRSVAEGRGQFWLPSTPPRSPRQFADFVSPLLTRFVEGARQAAPEADEGAPLAAPTKATLGIGLVGGLAAGLLAYMALK